MLYPTEQTCRLVEAAIDPDSTHAPAFNDGLNLVVGDWLSSEAVEVLMCSSQEVTGPHENLSGYFSRGVPS
jgi:hypothetical protein